MNTEPEAWRQLQRKAADQLSPDFADRVLRGSRGPSPLAWRQLATAGAACVRPGFAERVLRAARRLPGGPSWVDQFVWSAATASVCMLGVLFLHDRTNQAEEERNLARWHALAVEVQDVEFVQ